MFFLQFYNKEHFLYSSSTYFETCGLGCVTSNFKRFLSAKFLNCGTRDSATLAIPYWYVDLFIRLTALRYVAP